MQLAVVFAIVDLWRCYSSQVKCPTSSAVLYANVFVHRSRDVLWSQRG